MVAMNTQERAEAVAQATEPFRALLGPATADDLLGWLQAEFGHAEALDRWTNHGQAKARAIAPDTILHVVSGNTPHAALQSLIGGLLLGSINLVKLPRGGIIEVDEFIAALPEALRETIETDEELPSGWIARAFPFSRLAIAGFCRTRAQSEFGTRLGRSCVCLM
jgi:hypothetical protein